MYEIKVEAQFSAAHHLLNYEGECEKQHGHNWKVEVFVRGENLDNSNILVEASFDVSEGQQPNIVGILFRNISVNGENKDIEIKFQEGYDLDENNNENINENIQAEEPQANNNPNFRIPKI